MKELLQEKQSGLLELKELCDEQHTWIRDAIKRIEAIDKSVYSLEAAREQELANITQVINADWEQILKSHAIQIADNMTNRIVSRQLELIPGYSLYSLMTMEDKLKWLEAVRTGDVFRLTTEELVPKYKAKPDTTKTKKDQKPA